MPAITETTAAVRFVKRELAEDKGKAETVRDFTTLYADSKDKGGLVAMAAAINAERTKQGIHRDRPLTFQGVAIYVTTGKLIASYGVEVTERTAYAAFRFIARNPNGAFLAAWHESHGESVTDAESFVSSMLDAYKALAESKTALRESAAAEASDPDKGRRDDTVTARDTLAVSAGDSVPSSVDAMAASLRQYASDIDGGVYGLDDLETLRAIVAGLTVAIADGIEALTPVTA